MNYLTLSEVVTIAEKVLNVEAKVLLLASRVDLADSAIHAPMASFGGVEFYPGLAQKVGVLGYRLARNHPFPDGNKRVAFKAMIRMAKINGSEWTDLNNDPKDAEAVEMMFEAAAGTIDEDTFIAWVEGRVK